MFYFNYQSINKAPIHSLQAKQATKPLAGLLNFSKKTTAQTFNTTPQNKAPIHSLQAKQATKPHAGRRLLSFNQSTNYNHHERKSNERNQKKINVAIVRKSTRRRRKSSHNAKHNQAIKSYSGKTSRNLYTKQPY